MSKAYEIYIDNYIDTGITDKVISFKNVINNFEIIIKNSINCYKPEKFEPIYQLFSDFIIFDNIKDIKNVYEMFTYIYNLNKNNFITLLQNDVYLQVKCKDESIEIKHKQFIFKNLETTIKVNYFCENINLKLIEFISLIKNNIYNELF